MSLADAVAFVAGAALGLAALTCLDVLRLRRRVEGLEATVVRHAQLTCDHIRLTEMTRRQSKAGEP